MRDKSLSFIPPDGRFTLMEYRYAPTATPNTLNASASADAIPLALAILKDTVPIPISAKINVEFDESLGKLWTHKDLRSDSQRASLPYSLRLIPTLIS